ncbi:hypothetical protein QTP88_026547 [Uroleucon formosanum]
MNNDSFNELLEMISPIITKQDTVMRKAISPTERLATTLRFLATGRSFEDLKFSTAIAPQTISSIILETCEAMITKLQEYIQLPKNSEGWSAVAKGFESKWNFPHCIGAVDGKHIAVQKPKGSGFQYYNYKHFFSLVLMAVVDSNYEFIMVDVGANGCMSDGAVITNTKFGQLLEKGELNIPPPKIMPNSNYQLPFVFVGDEAFALKDNFMKPFPQRNLTREERVFNYRLSRARRIVENTFGILVSRFRLLLTTINLSPEKVQRIVLACCYLHNFLRRKIKDQYSDISKYNNFDDPENDVNIEHPQLHCLQPLRGRNASISAKNIRLKFCDYFNNEGKVTWQENII